MQHNTHMMFLRATSGSKRALNEWPHMDTQLLRERAYGISRCNLQLHQSINIISKLVCLSCLQSACRVVIESSDVSRAHVLLPPNCPSAGVFCSNGGPTPTSIRRASRVHWPVSVTERAPHHFPANPLRRRRPSLPPAVPVAVCTPTAPTADADVRPPPPTVHVPAVRSSMWVQYTSQHYLLNKTLTKRRRLFCDSSFARVLQVQNNKPKRTIQKIGYTSITCLVDVICSYMFEYVSGE